MTDIERVRSIVEWIDRGVAVSKIGKILAKAAPLQALSHIIPNELVQADYAQWQQQVHAAVSAFDDIQLDQVYGQIFSSYSQAVVFQDILTPLWKQLLQRQDLDLTIVTRQPGKEIGQLLRQERFAWAVAQGFDPHEQNPMPLAMFNADCFCREWACNALDAMGRPYRIAYTSPSLSAIMAAVSAGLAITAQLQSLVTPDLQVIGEAEGLPSMPMASIVLLRNERTQSPVTETLAEHIVEGFRF